MRQRVFTYITRQDQLLVLDRPEAYYPEPQIPGGTIKPGELPEHAALREATEETGLSSLELVSLLGSFEKDLHDIGRDETIIAWFFHLRTNDATPPSWKHYESDPSEGTGPLEFQLYWVPISDIPQLGGIDSAMLEDLKESVTHKREKSMRGMVFCRACGKEIHHSARACPHCGATQQVAGQGKNKIVAGILALFLGGLGIHRFYLGQWWGVFYLLFVWTLIPLIVAFVEAIVFFCANDSKWEQKYGGG